jgi:hypothetical protein
MNISRVAAAIATSSLLAAGDGETIRFIISGPQIPDNRSGKTAIVIKSQDWALKGYLIADCTRFGPLFLNQVNEIRLRVVPGTAHEKGCVTSAFRLDRDFKTCCFVIPPNIFARIIFAPGE